VRRLGLDLSCRNWGWLFAGGFVLRAVVAVVGEPAVLNRSLEGAGRILGAGIDGSGAFKLSREAVGRREAVLGTGSRERRGMALAREGTA